MDDLQRVRKVVNWLIYNDFGINEQEIAQKLGYTKSSFSQILNGKVPLSTRFVEKLCDIDKNINKVWVSAGKGNMLNEMNNIYDFSQKGKIPVYLSEAAAGYASFDELLSDEKVKDYYYIPDFSSADFMIRLYGSSMMPKFASGDIVICKIIRDASFIQWNRPYIIATKGQGLLCKRIGMSENENSIKAMSENKNYPPFEIPKDEVVGIALIIGVLHHE